MNFADILKTLPEASGERMTLSDASGQVVAVIHNASGTAGAFRVYAYLLQTHGAINLKAAAEGLKLFSEHTDNAAKHRGNHPNIDRLIDLMNTGATLTAHITRA
jgi:hypothetical protein